MGIADDEFLDQVHRLPPRLPRALCSPSDARRSAGIGDLLVAPTRIVLDGRKGAEVILNNIGDEPATYRVSVEFRRMTPDGGLVDVAEPTRRRTSAPRT